jgi:hypothetical protein
MSHRKPRIVVHADWDEEAGTWSAAIVSVDGLAIGADNIEQLLKRVPGAIADLIKDGFVSYRVRSSVGIIE